MTDVDAGLASFPTQFTPEAAAFMLGLGAGVVATLLLIGLLRLIAQDLKKLEEARP